MVRVRLWASVAIVAASAAWLSPITSSYTSEQTSAGRAAYQQNCASCHGTGLRQLPEALLAGREFVARWGSRGTNELVTQMRASMPPTDPGGLHEDTYRAIAASILQANGAGEDL